MSIYEWTDRDGLKWCIIAGLTADSKSYVAPLTKAGRKATGKQVLIAETLDELGASPHVPKFASFADAQRALSAARALKLD